MTTSTEQVASGLVPEWTLGDRMRKAAEVAGMEIAELADELGVHRLTVSRWLNGKNRPSRGMVRAIAAVTGVSFEWLSGDSGDVVRPLGLEPRTR